MIFTNVLFKCMWHHSEVLLSFLILGTHWYSQRSMSSGPNWKPSSWGALLEGILQFIICYVIHLMWRDRYILKHWCLLNLKSKGHVIIFEVMYLKDKLASRVYKELQILNSKTHNLMKKWAKEMNRYFPKDQIQMNNRHTKTCSGF